MSDYRPIDCARYSEYELAIMHRERLRIAWQEPGGQPRIDVVTPIDLLTLNHEEFLVVDRAEDHGLRLRLDYIRKTETL
jgi:Rho-binding antiterminator